MRLFIMLYKQKEDYWSGNITEDTYAIRLNIKCVQHRNKIV